MWFVMVEVSRNRCFQELIPGPPVKKFNPLMYQHIMKKEISQSV